jgi:hypothetical protein
MLAESVAIAVLTMAVIFSVGTKTLGRLTPAHLPTSRRTRFA